MNCKLRGFYRFCLAAQKLFTIHFFQDFTLHLCRHDQPLFLLNLPNCVLFVSVHHCVDCRILLVFLFLKTINLISCIIFIFRTNYLCYTKHTMYLTYNISDITHCIACTILTSNYSNQQMHKNNSKSYITYSIPRCFNADSPTPGNPEYKGVQLPKQQFGITVIKYQNIKFMKLLSSLTSEVI